MRLELDALQSTENHHGGRLGGKWMSVSSVANLLQQILYSRRGFPFYSFCVVAGLHRVGGEGGGGGNNNSRRVTRQEGAVYVYDAIGSYERVAVASAGTGRELLQPILDQLFSSSSSGITHRDDDDGGGGGQDNKHPVSEKKLDGGGDIVISSIPPERQRVGVAGSLRPPVPTTVACSIEDAVKNVARAYQSVAEREISVGDEVVICVVISSATAASSSAVGSGAAEEEGAVLRVYRYPLKKH